MAHLCENIMAGENGHLHFAGQDVTELARQYGTPLYLLDEDRIRSNCRRYRGWFQENFGENFRLLYASKANSFRQVYRIMTEENMGVDVVSCGEIYTAKTAGFDLSMAYFHGNNKTDDDIAYAMEQGVGYFVVDGTEELLAVEQEAAARGIRQKILLRVTPGIDPHTYEAVATGKVDSKFGVAIETGQAAELTALAVAQSHLSLEGFHCHVGSQVFWEDVYERAAAVMVRFMAEMHRQCGLVTHELDMGGGFGVAYVEDDERYELADRIRSMADVIKNLCAENGIPVPMVLMEPGRAVVADAGMTVYTVGSVKRIDGYKNYVSIDGGMTDNPRFALYGSAYTCLPANRMQAERNFTCSIVGRCCESGDIIQENVPMPSEIQRGDQVAVCTTGAYNYSMASNYNRVARPPIVMLRGGESYVAVRRETLEDMAALDV